MRHIPVRAIYGKVVIHKAFCENCQGMSFVLDGRFVCCDSECKEEIKKYKRESAISDYRKGPRKKLQEELLEKQEYRCFYCGMMFGSTRHKHESGRNRALRLNIEFDHYVPFSETGDNSDDNYVASCQICNKLKKSLIFQTAEEARVYLQNERERLGYDF